MDRYKFKPEDEIYYVHKDHIQLMISSAMIYSDGDYGHYYNRSDNSDRIFIKIKIARSKLLKTLLGV